jgi:hypothetical protein
MMRSGSSLWGSTQDWSAALARWIRSLELLTEPDIRSRLSALGYDEQSVAVQITKARRTRQLNWSATWERVTTIGYRNVEGQRVIAKTSRAATDAAQRVFLMRCTVCGHEYGSLGRDIPKRCCPACQEGPPGEGGV